MKHLIACTLVIFALALVPALAKKALSVDSEITHYTDEQATELFRDFVAYHAKNYKSETEEALRLQAFRDNLHYIAKHNREAAKGKHTYTLGLTPLADLTYEEYKEQYLSGFNATIGDDNDDDDDHFREEFRADDVDYTPSSVDWRYLSSPVRNQGACGSCWAFSTVSMIESAWRQAGKAYTDLSEQQLVDCVAGGTYTCSRGGNMRVAAQDIINRGGIQDEYSYGYCACSGRQCRFNKANVITTIRSFAGVTADEKALISASAKISSVSVAIDASSREFQLYKSGTFSGPCGTSLNHAVNIVGYHPDFWIVRNSWGSGWGYYGYIYMARGRNICGINQYGTVVYL